MRYADYPPEEQEKIDDYAIAIHRARLYRDGICTIMHRYDNIGLWFKFDDRPYYAYPETIKRAIDAYETGKEIEEISIYYTEYDPFYTDEIIRQKITEIQETDNHPILQTVLENLYIFDFSDIDSIVGYLDDIIYSIDNDEDYTDEIENIEYLVELYVKISPVV